MISGGTTMAALGLVFILLPCLSIIAFTGFAACRAQRPRVFKLLAALCLSAGLVCALVPVGTVTWFLFL
ncbi:hypothetical protein [Streptomyces sp. NPDC029674]|uniref:hypothetical protein n=1 Tax=Streptomyces sp. NPDC029674 TaxID=3365297 RepID=UPI00384F670D